MAALATPAVLLLCLFAAAAVSSAADYHDLPGGATVPIFEKSLPSNGTEKVQPLIIAVEGVVSCKSGSNYHHLEGKFMVFLKGKKMLDFNYFIPMILKLQFHPHVVHNRMQKIRVYIREKKVKKLYIYFLLLLFLFVTCKILSCLM